MSSRRRTLTLGPSITLLALVLGAGAGTGCASSASRDRGISFGTLPSRFAKCYPGPERDASAFARIEANSSVVVVKVAGQEIHPYARVVDVEPGVCDLTVVLTYNAYTSARVPLRFYAERGGTYAVQAVVDEHHKTWLPIVTDTRSDEAALVLNPAAPRPTGPELRAILEMHRQARERAVKDPSNAVDPQNPSDDPPLAPEHPDSEGFAA